MKCEHCGKNEVSFVYRSSVNGKVEEHRLCRDCAEKLGYTRDLFAQSRSLLGGFFERDPFFGDSFFDGFFTPLPTLMGRLLESPLDDVFAEMPALGSAPAKEEKQDDLMSREEQDWFSRLRRVNALKLEQKKAIHEQNFERAAEIRDELKRLEAERKQQKSEQESA